MKKSAKILFFGVFCVVFCAAMLVSCRRPQRQVAQIEATLLARQTAAEQLSTRMLSALSQEPVCIDSLHDISASRDAIFFVYQGERMLYWSDNLFSLKHLPERVMGEWQYCPMDNAHAICCWQEVGAYQLLTVVPIKYNFPFENRQLHNTFIAPFEGNESWQIFGDAGSEEHYAVVDRSGTPLFYLCSHQLENKKAVESAPLAESFSYQNLSAKANNEANRQSSRARIRLYFIITIIVFALIFIWCVGVLIYYRGFRNMRIGTKMQLFVMFLLLSSFIYIFVVSMVYVRRNYASRQQETIEAKCRYVQNALKHIYADVPEVDNIPSEDVYRTLSSLSLTYETDIHVYGLSGELVGSSTPTLFSEGLISTRMRPDIFFSNTTSCVKYEDIGDLHYLVSYAELYNKLGRKIGYLALPSFVTQEQMMQQVDGYLMRILPAYLVALVLGLLCSLLLTRSLSVQLRQLSQHMKDFRLGRQARYSHLTYNHNDEVGELVRQYNAMVDQLERSTRRLASSERDAAWRTMARQIAHEINNPLTPMKLTIQQLQRTRDTERFDEYFQRATRMLIEQIDNLSHIASSFSTFAKMPEVCPEEVDVAQKLMTVITLMRQNDAHIPIRYIGADQGVMAMADPEQISQVFTNLLKNALQALDNKEDADIIVTLNMSPADPQTCPVNLEQEGLQDAVELVFYDNAGGIDPQFWDKIFTPNFTTKSTGTGLGLAISKNIVEGSGGKICFQTSEKGTKFFVYLRKKS